MVSRNEAPPRAMRRSGEASEGAVDGDVDPGVGDGSSRGGRGEEGDEVEDGG